MMWPARPGARVSLLLILFCLLQDRCALPCGAEEKVDTRRQAQADADQTLDTQAQREYQAGRYKDALPLCQRAIQQKTTVDRLLLKGNCLEKMKRFDDALAAFNAALALQPDNTSARFARAWVYLGLNQPRNTIVDCDKILRLNPDHAAALDARGMAQLRLGNPTAAVRDFEKSIRISPAADPEKLYHLGCAYGALGRMTEGAAVFTRYIALEPKRIGGYISRAQCFGALKQFNKAFADLHKARQFDKNNFEIDKAQAQIEINTHPEKVPPLLGRVLSVKPDADAYELRAKAFKILGQYGAAIADWTRAIELADNPQRRAERADCLLQVKKPSQAEEDARMAIKNGAGFLVQPHRALSASLMSQKKFCEAIQSADDWAKRNPVSDDEPRRVIVACYETLGQFDKALASLRQWQKAKPSALSPQNSRRAYELGSADVAKLLEAKGKHVGSETTLSAIDERIRQYPQEAAYYVIRGKNYSRIFENSKAQSDYTRAIKLDPLMVEALVGRAENYKLSGQEERALKDLNGALKLDPKFAFALLLRGKTLAALHDYDRAVADFTKLVQFGNPSNEVLLCRAQALLQAGRLKQAGQECRTIIKRYPRDWGVYLILAGTHEKAGDLKGAIQDLTEALAIAPEEIDLYRQRARLYQKCGKPDLAQRDKQRAEQIAAGIMNIAPFRSK